MLPLVLLLLVLALVFLLLMVVLLLVVVVVLLLVVPSAPSPPPRRASCRCRRRSGDCLAPYLLLPRRRRADRWVSDKNVEFYFGLRLLYDHSQTVRQLGCS